MSAALLFSWKARMIVYINPKTHIQTRQNAIFGHARYAKGKTIFTYNKVVFLEWAKNNGKMGRNIE